MHSPVAQSSGTSLPVIPFWSQRVEGEPDPTNREIIAYQSGKEDGKTEAAESTKQLFFTNLEMCCYYSTKFFDFITKEKKISCELATIKAESISQFRALFIINFNEYKDKALRTDLFKEANEYRKALKVKDVCLEISLLPVSGAIDKSEIFNDGFFLQHTKD